VYKQLVFKLASRRTEERLVTPDLLPFCTKRCFLRRPNTDELFPSVRNRETLARPLVSAFRGESGLRIGPAVRHMLRTRIVENNSTLYSFEPRQGAGAIFVTTSGFRWSIERDKAAVVAGLTLSQNNRLWARESQ
jgi:hypothetical protein